MNERPANVGICLMELYFPKHYVSQEKLEVYDGVSKGKYTIGLGQSKMGFCGDLEDINSLCLTVVQNLLENNNIDPKDVGRLEVGTETIIDKSKSVKSVLMQLFEECGNSNIEGVDTTNACYGGTAALFNAINWVESSSWDGRLAIVVAADIAVYAAGSARCTGGAGAVAMVIAPNAPLVFESKIKSTYMAHAYDFYKPNLSSEYPVINGKLSLQSYISALDICYDQYAANLKSKVDANTSSLELMDFLIFHTPYCKLIQKSVGRCFLHNYLKKKNENGINQFPMLDKYQHLSIIETFKDEILFKEIEKASVQYSAELFKQKTESSLFLAKNVGNMYAPSLYGSLISLLMNVSCGDLFGKRIALFSYGSGLASSMFSLRVCLIEDGELPLQRLLDSLQSVKSRLSQRIEVEPGKFVEILELREKGYNVNEFVPKCSPVELFDGTYYLTSIDSQYRRFYARK